MFMENRRGFGYNCDDVSPETILEAAHSPAGAMVRSVPFVRHFLAQTMGARTVLDRVRSVVSFP
jgi:hypothetical protein